MDRRHAIRNWLHHFLLALQAADAEAAAARFARAEPVDIRGPEPHQQWQSWEAWRDYLQQQLAPLRPGTLGFRTLQEPEIRGEGELVRLHVHLHCRVTSQDGQAIALAADATLVEEEGQWVARGLHCHLLPPA